MWRGINQKNKRLIAFNEPIYDLRKSLCETLRQKKMMKHYDNFRFHHVAHQSDSSFRAHNCAECHTKLSSCVVLKVLFMNYSYVAK